MFFCYTLITVKRNFYIEDELLFPIHGNGYTGLCVSTRQGVLAESVSVSERVNEISYEITRSFRESAEGLVHILPVSTFIFQCVSIRVCGHLENLSACCSYFHWISCFSFSFFCPSL